MKNTEMSRVVDGWDSQVRIQDDLYRAVNGSWMDTTPIPDDESRIGAFMDLRNVAEEHIRDILTSPEGGETADFAKARRLYDSWMDVETLEALGTTPLDSDVADVRGATSKEELATIIGRLSTQGVGTFFGYGVDSSFDDPNLNVFFMGQAGISLPDEAYYRDPTFAPILEAFKEHVPGMWQLATGDSEEKSGEVATTIIGLETAIASSHMSVVDSRNVDLLNNPMSFNEFVEKAPGFEWAKCLVAAGYKPEELGTITVFAPDALAGAAQLWETTSLDDLKTYTLWRIIRARATFLTPEIDAKNFDFYGKILMGAQEQRDRWKRGVQLVNGTLGEAVGKVYVEQHFPPAAKKQMDVLVADLLEAYRQSITALDWMGEETKKRALEKVDSFVPKIGYPEKWRDYSTVNTGANLVDNMRSISEYEASRERAKLGKPVDRTEWFMNPQTVNAYYNPQWNEIVFPAAILQFPFFVEGRDAALNYGGIGAVIGHEIGHGFDDQGSKYDAQGAVSNWWTEQDREEFEKRTSNLVEQFNQYVPAQFGDNSEFHVNGELTLGENIGDLGGLSIAVKAYKIHLERNGLTPENTPNIDGFTALQRIFLSFARIWRGKERNEFLQQQIATDPHSPGEFRCNGIVKNIDTFSEAFNLKQGDALYLPPETRVKIW
ncbi:M13-type metalloendopeptidase [Actinotignum urinale]|uniref:M13 family metallopeptidase n=1 Tax=Actinotignum urinale TaxID=190146 RepID=UPI0003B5E1EA|nr:M13-type metalloendopeptidase [Actinotignum urinale]MDY5152369.1 M13-type metalloendopeptidase [Actinotignum urinale]MDY5160689.1 M13-type metalloendopeptidase [Actinotignum urinale]